jgi:ABC-2 type transport system ATP-binding protein/lipopolysaccharide transport system ATP-binding protein
MISVRHLSKRFWLQGERRTTLKERLVRGRGVRGREFWAVRDASFDVPPGTTLGIVGHNGSGKSTVLKVLAGIYRPTTGTVHVNGRVSALLELGAGFNPELTGRDNIRLNGAILGMTRREVDEAMDGIVDFSGIGEFIDAPVKVYSSGMYVRLGFAVAVSINPEILIVDEVIAVGDEEFQRRCFDHLHELRQRGTTIVLVSHDLGLIRDLCDRALWLDHGHVREIGASRDVVEAYIGDVNQREASTNQETREQPAGERPSRLGSGEIRVTKVEFLDVNQRPSAMLVAGEACTFRIHYSAHSDLDQVIFGFGFHHESGVVVAGPNSGRLGAASVPRGQGYVDFFCPELVLAPSAYSVTTAIVDKGHTFDYLDRGFEVRVRGRGDEEPGLARMLGSWTPPVRTSDSPGEAQSAPEGLIDVQQ